MTDLGLTRKKILTKHGTIFWPRRGKKHHQNLLFSIRGAYFWKKEVRSLISQGFGQGYYARFSFAWQQYFSKLLRTILVKMGKTYQWKMIVHRCRIANGIKNKNIKNSLGAMWNASHLGVWLCVLRHRKRVSMPPTTQPHTHPLTRAIHIAPRTKTTRRFTAKNPWR